MRRFSSVRICWSKRKPQILIDHVRWNWNSKSFTGQRSECAKR
jgi:hypothetical protein